MNRTKVFWIILSWSITLLLAVVIGFLFVQYFQISDSQNQWGKTVYEFAVENETNGNIQDARLGYKIIVTQNPGYKDAQNRLASIEALLSKNHYNAGVLHTNSQQWDQALWEFERALELNPDSTNARLAREQVLQKLGQSLTPFPKKNVTFPELEIQASPLTFLILIGIWIAMFLLGASLTKTNLHLLQPPLPQKQSDILTEMVGDEPSRNLIGEMYETVYLFKRKSVSISGEFLIGIIGEFLRRFLKLYNLRPVGNLGDLVEFDSDNYIPYGFISSGDKVWIIKVGWRQGDQVLIKPLVTKDHDEISKIGRTL